LECRWRRQHCQWQALTGSQGPSLQGPAASALKFKLPGQARPGGTPEYPAAIMMASFSPQPPHVTLPRRWRWISDHCRRPDHPAAGSNAVDLTCNWNRSRTTTAGAATGSRTDPPELRSPSCFGLPAIVGFRDFAATVRGCMFLSRILCFYKIRGAQAFCITHGTASETCRV
jgi:hypothetical protein